MCPIFNRAKTWLDAYLERIREPWRWFRRGSEKERKSKRAKKSLHVNKVCFMQTSAIKNDYSFICVLNWFQLLSTGICAKHRMSNMQMRCLCKVNHTVSHRHWQLPDHKFNFSRLRMIFFLIRRLNVEHGSESKMWSERKRDDWVIESAMAGWNM